MFLGLKIFKLYQVNFFAKYIESMGAHNSETARNLANPHKLR